MAKVCTQITEWIEEKVSRPVTEWVEERERKCKKLKWYDPRRWLCWVVTNFVKVVRWIVVNVVKMVITIVCRLIGRVLAILLDIARLIYLGIKALVTWDKCVLQEALSELVDLFIHVITILHVFIDPFADAINKYRLRRYVRDEIEARFADQPDVIEALKDAFHVDHGVFGLRSTCTLYRMYVDSRTQTARYTDVPNLLGLHRDGHINLYELAGFDHPCALFSGEGWYRPRHQTAKFPFAGGGGDAVPPELTEDELREYIESDGQRGPHFRIYAIHPRNLNTRLDTSEETARSLGIIFNFEKDEIGITHEELINYSTTSQRRLLIDELGRHDVAAEPELARMDLCSPVAVAIFGFSNKRLRGWSWNLFETECAAHNLGDHSASGVTFIDDIPDEVRRYVLVHELGHYFGLCHVDGFSRIMVSGAEGQGDAVTAGSIVGYLLFGGPRFTLDDGKQVWRYILTHFPLACLLGRADPDEPPIPVVP
jgi:hypothetical protein